MNSRIGFIVAVGLGVLSCGTRENASQNIDEIAGDYVREYNFKVINRETGNEIGMRSVRDTISIRPGPDGYEISNTKWRLNDYDREGWQNMEHSDDRPMEAFHSILDPSDNTLYNSSSMPNLHIDLRNRLLFLGKTNGSIYRKATNVGF